MANKQQLGYKEIEKRLKVFREKRINSEEIGYVLLYSFGKGERDIARYKEGKGVLKTFDGLLIKGLFCYRSVSDAYLTDELERLKSDIQVLKAMPKIIAVSDGDTILAYDLREKDTYENRVERLYCDFAFFYPLMNIERVHYVEESPADVKAAEKLAKLHDELRAYNEFNSEADLHDLNIFITRILFCFFAEDTGIFEENLFSASIRQFTKPDGSDLSEYLDAAFNIMDCDCRTADMPSVILQFPYVNGGLFAKRIQIPKMSGKARKIILECGELDWKNINPDIFGSMIQAVVNPEERANQGMHYTSVPNIMKVINPLFLDELRGEYNKLKEEYEKQRQLFDLGGQTGKQLKQNCQAIIKKSNELLARMSKMKFFDPACGSGNFLIITYKSLRILEMDILLLQQQCEGGQRVLSSFVGSVIRLQQFYGIELLDFPHEVAMLSMWLAEHQMNKKLFEIFGVVTDALPLHNITQIVCGNACRLDWKVVCPHEKDEEVFVFGNPPYLGSRRQSVDQKNDMKFVFENNYGELDYISCWFLVGADFIRNTCAKYAFVSTNSICQGLQMSLLWERIFDKGLAIDFAYTSFKWANNAKNKAAVTVVVIGVSNENKIKTRKLFHESTQKEVNNISPLLLDAPTIFVKGRALPLLPQLPVMNFGNMPADGGKLLLNDVEKSVIIQNEPEAEKFIKPLIGAEEFINGKNRWCIWLYDEEELAYEGIQEFKKRINDLRVIRENSSRPKLAEIPHLFAQVTQPMHTSFILIPRHSSENRDYIPIGFFQEGNIAHDSTLVIGTEDISLFGLLTSRMHMTWVKTVGGRLKTDYRYSAKLCYNTFPFPTVGKEKKRQIEEAAENVLITRACYPERTLAKLYDPDKMPEDLKDAHSALDDIVESCYSGYPFANDEARLECLFKLYEKMTKK